MFCLDLYATHACSIPDARAQDESRLGVDGYCTKKRKEKIDSP